jgi:RNA polymerase sigma-70 factor (ECF subfamily)
MDEISKEPGGDRTRMKQQRPVGVDRARLAQLYQQHAPKILDYVSRHVSSSHDAEDVLIDVFVAALESIPFASLTEQEQQAWLWRVARNKVIDRYRRSLRVPLQSIDENQFIEDAVMDPERISIRQEENDHLASQLKRLSPLQQRVLYLRFGENLRCAEIASLVGKREGSIRSLLSRAFNLLRRYYQDQEKGEHLDEIR